MKPLSQLVYDYIFDSILFNLYLKSNSKKLYSAELDKVYSTIRSFMCKDDAENFTVSIAKKLNKPNFINSANLTANVCKAFSLIKLITKNLDDDEQHYFMASSIEEKKRFHDLVSIFITLPLSCNYNYPAQYHNEVYAKVFTFQYQHIAKFIFRHAQQVADVAMIYNIVKKINNNNSYFSIKDVTNIYYNKLINDRVSVEEVLDSICRTLYKKKMISIAKDAAKAANLYNKVKELNDKDTQSPILEIKDAIRISKMSSGAQNIIVTSITQPLYKKKMISIAKDAAKAANLYNKVKELNDKDTQSPVLGIKDAIRISKMSSGAQNIIVTSITQPLYKKKII